MVRNEWHWPTAQKKENICSGYGFYNIYLEHVVPVWSPVETFIFKTCNGEYNNNAVFAGIGAI